MKIGTQVYYARIIPQVELFEVEELKIRTIKDTWFVGIDKHSKQSFLLYNNDINKTVFFDRDEALFLVLDAIENYKQHSV